MSISKTVNLNTLAQGAGKIFSLIFGFLTILILRRFLGQSGFGDYVFILSFVTVFVSLSDFGTHLILVKEVAQKEKIQAKLLGSCLLLRLFLSFLASLTAFLIVLLFFKDRGIYALALLALPLIALVGFKNSLMVLFHCLSKLYYASLQEVFVSFLLLLAAIFLAWQQGNLGNYIFLASLSYFLTLIPFSFLAFQVAQPKFEIDSNLLKHLFCQSFPLGLILLTFTLYSRVDTIILKFVWGAGSVGIYGLSFKIYENLTLPAAFFMNATLPLLSRKVKKSGKEKICALLQKLVDLLILGAAIFIIAGVFAAPFIIKILTGTYGEEVFVLRILLFALPFAFLNHLAGYTIIALGQQKKSLIISALALLFNLLANIILIPKFSFKAAAANTIATQVLVFILSLRILKNQLNFWPNFFTWPQTAREFILKKGRIFDDFPSRHPEEP